MQVFNSYVCYILSMQEPIVKFENLKYVRNEYIKNEVHKNERYI